MYLKHWQEIRIHLNSMSNYLRLLNLLLYSFRREMIKNPEILGWFTKPEKAMNQRFNDNLSKQEFKDKKIKEGIEAIR